MESAKTAAPTSTLCQSVPMSTCGMMNQVEITSHAPMALFKNRAAGARRATSATTAMPSPTIQVFV